MLKDGGLRTRPANDGDNGASDGPGPPIVLPDTMIRTMEGRIIAWSQGIERRYGFTRADALGKISHELLKTEFPRALQKIEATLVSEMTWSGVLIHHRADGSAVPVATQWYVKHDGNDKARVTEVHSDLTSDREELCGRLGEVIELLAHELSEPLTSIRNYIDGVQRILRTGWPDLGRARDVLSAASIQIDRGAEDVRFMRKLAVAIRDTE
jgi:PAS domain S-box-containing protein